MPLAAAEGGITLAEEFFRAQLAASARFQAWCKATTAAAALPRIFCDALPPPKGDESQHSLDELVAFRPFAIVWTDENAGYRRTRLATECYAESGTLNVQLEQDVADTDGSDPQQMLRKFKNDLGVIISDLEQLAYQAGYVAFDEIHMRGPWRAAQEEIPQMGDHLFAFLTISWGVQQ